MNKPVSELPWSVMGAYNDYIGNEEGCVIYDSNVDAGDAQYIVEACNNYPKAVELLRCVLYESCIESEFDKSIKEFLDDIEVVKSLEDNDDDRYSTIR